MTTREVGKAGEHVATATLIEAVRRYPYSTTQLLQAGDASYETRVMAKADYDALRAATVAVLEPFAAMLEAGSAYIDDFPDGREIFAINGKSFTAGDLRTARALRERLKV